MKTVALHNLGCKVNSYEVDVMQQLLQKAGYKIVQFNQKADIYVINTCSVTNMADRKSRQMLHKARKMNPEAIVIAVGCFVQADAYQAAQDEAIDLLIGNNRKKDIVEILDAYEEETERIASGETLYEQWQTEGDSGEGEATEEEQLRYLRKTLGNTTIVDVTRVSFEEACVETTADHTRAYIKIQDGCNRFCSYCIIPYTRGRVRSRAPEQVLAEVEGLTKCGYKEFVLTGIHISSYGLDFEEKNPGKSLLELMRGINAIPGVKRIRIGSFEPMILTPSFVDDLASIEKLCPHFHISLQSGSDATLKRMNRRYTSVQYLEKVELLRRTFQNPAITTDVIVGFPGETDEEFAETKEFLERVGFYEMHIFKYSRRKGTRADLMPDQIPEQVKNSRSNCLLELEQEMSGRYRNTFAGKEVSVLFEERKEVEGKQYWVGHTPEYVTVAAESNEDLTNRIVKVVLRGQLSADVCVADL